MSQFKEHGLVLAVHPISRGFGWVLFEGPLIPVDWGIASAKVNKSEQCMKRFKQLLDRYQPSAVIVEKFPADDDSRRGERIRTLAQTMRGFAEQSRYGYARYIAGTKSAPPLSGNTNATRHAVACTVAELLPVLSAPFATACGKVLGTERQPPMPLRCRCSRHHALRTDSSARIDTCRFCSPAFAPTTRFPRIREHRNPPVFPLCAGGIYGKRCSFRIQIRRIHDNHEQDRGQHRSRSRYIHNALARRYLPACVPNECCHRQAISGRQYPLAVG